jgi:hypothetical protein
VRPVRETDSIDPIRDRQGADNPNPKRKRRVYPSRERQRPVKPKPPRSLAERHAPGYNSSMPNLDQLDNLQRIQRESEQQSLPQQEKVFAVAKRVRSRLNNLPDPTHPPLGWVKGRGFDEVFPFIRLPELRPRYVELARIASSELSM